jgi:hypothetical protein
MGPGEHRPHDNEYWTPPWSATLFAGDLFEAIPFGDQPTVTYAGEEEPVAGPHFNGVVADLRYDRPARRRLGTSVPGPGPCATASLRC